MSQSLVKAQRIVDRLNVFTSVANRPSQAVPLRSSAFRNWFFGQYWSEYDAIPPPRPSTPSSTTWKGAPSANPPTPASRRPPCRLGRDSLGIDLATPAGWTVQTLRACLNLASHADWLRCLA